MSFRTPGRECNFRLKETWMNTLARLCDRMVNKWSCLCLLCTQVVRWCCVEKTSQRISFLCPTRSISPGKIFDQICAIDLKLPPPGVLRIRRGIRGMLAICGGPSDMSICGVWWSLENCVFDIWEAFKLPVCPPTCLASSRLPFQRFSNAYLILPGISLDLVTVLVSI